MNRWAANNPELYEELGHEGYVDHFRSQVDRVRKERQEGKPHPAPSAPRSLACPAMSIVVVVPQSLDEDRQEREGGR